MTAGAVDGRAAGSRGGGLRVRIHPLLAAGHDRVERKPEPAGEGAAAGRSRAHVLRVTSPGSREEMQACAGRGLAVSECRARSSSDALPARSGCTPARAACRSPVPDDRRAPRDREAASAERPNVRHKPSSAAESGVRSRASDRCGRRDGRPRRSIRGPSFVSPSRPSSPSCSPPTGSTLPLPRSSARPGSRRKVAARPTPVGVAAPVRSAASRRGGPVRTDLPRPSRRALRGQARRSLTWPGPQNRIRAPCLARCPSSWTRPGSPAGRSE